MGPWQGWGGQGGGFGTPPASLLRPPLLGVGRAGLWFWGKYFPAKQWGLWADLWQPGVLIKQMFASVLGVFMQSSLAEGCGSTRSASCYCCNELQVGRQRLAGCGAKLGDSVALGLAPRGKNQHGWHPKLPPCRFLAPDHTTSSGEALGCLLVLLVKWGGRG